MDVVFAVLAILAAGACSCWPGASVRVVTQFERGVVLRFGRLHGEPREPGLTLIAPAVDRLHKVNMQVITMPVPAQEGITRDNVTVKVDAVVYFKVFDPVRVVVGVQSYQAAIAQVAQASLRSIIGKSELDDLLSNRERLNQGLELMLDSPAVDWGIHIDRVDIKDVALPEGDEALDVAPGRGRARAPVTGDHGRGRAAGVGEAGPGGRGHGRPPRGAAAAPAADRGGGGRREELDARAAVPRGAAPVPGAGDPRRRPAPATPAVPDPRVRTGGGRPRRPARRSTGAEPASAAAELTGSAGSLRRGRRRTVGLGGGQRRRAGDGLRPRVPRHQGARPAAAAAVDEQPVHAVGDGVERGPDAGSRRNRSSCSSVSKPSSRTTPQRVSVPLPVDGAVGERGLDRARPRTPGATATPGPRRRTPRWSATRAWPHARPVQAAVHGPPASPFPSRRRGWSRERSAARAAAGGPGPGRHPRRRPRRATPSWCARGRRRPPATASISSSSPR